MGFLENELSQFSKEEGVTLADSVETLGVDLRTRVDKLGAKEKARRKKCKVRFSLIKKNTAFQKNYTMEEVKKVLGYGASKDLGSSCSGDSSHGKVKIERQMAAAAGRKKSTTSLSLFIEAYGLEVEEELSTLATQYWAVGNLDGKMAAGAVMCETRDLGIKWLHWHTLIFEGDRNIDMRCICTKKSEEHAFAAGHDSLLGEVGSKA